MSELRVYHTERETTYITNGKNKIIYQENRDNQVDQGIIKLNHYLIPGFISLNDLILRKNKYPQFSSKFYTKGTIICPKTHCTILTSQIIESTETVDSDDFYVAVAELEKSQNKGKSILDVIDDVENDIYAKKVKKYQEFRKSVETLIETAQRTQNYSILP